MKTIEEKAKAYDEALEVAQRFYNNSVAITKKGLEDIFPELKESEDERALKIIKETLKSYNGGVIFGSLNERDYAECLYWLKEQGEHKKFRDGIQVGDKVTRNRDGMLVNLSQLNRVAKKDKQKPFDYEDANIQQKDFALKDKQKPTWSEEDERIYQSIIDDTVQENQLDSKQIDWLKFLKERVQPQPQTEWSEKDEAVLDALIRRLEGEDIYVSPHLAVESLKSLKERYSWKPSKEQIDALEKECMAHSNYELCRLLEQLKKLKEGKI